MDLGQFVPALLVAVTSFIAGGALDRVRLGGRVRQDLERNSRILDSLPADSSAHQLLLQHIDQQVRDVTLYEQPWLPEDLGSLRQTQLVRPLYGIVWPLLGLAGAVVVAVIVRVFGSFVFEWSSAQAAAKQDSWTNWFLAIGFLLATGLVSVFLLRDESYHQSASARRDERIQTATARIQGTPLAPPPPAEVTSDDSKTQSEPK